MVFFCEFYSKSLHCIKLLSSLLIYHQQAVICYEQPQNHPFISDDEKEYLQRKIDDYANERKSLPSTPWFSIFKSTSVLALILSTVKRYLFLGWMISQNINLIEHFNRYRACTVGHFTSLTPICPNTSTTSFTYLLKRTQSIRLCRKFWA